MIVVAGVIVGGVIVGRAIAHGDYSDHSDHGGYPDYDAIERRRREAEEAARRRQEQARIAAAKQELDDVIERNVTSFEKENDVSIGSRVHSADCSFLDFDADMAPMDNAAKNAIKRQVAQDLKAKIRREKDELKHINSVIVAINRVVLSDDSTGNSPNNGSGVAITVDSDLSKLKNRNV